MTTLNVRIEEKLKKEAQKTFADLGLDMSSAVKLFLTQAVREKGLPFVPSLDTKKIAARWDAQSQSALRVGEHYSDAKSMMDDILA